MSDLEKRTDQPIVALDEYAVYIEKETNKVTWGSGREYSFKVGARPIQPESELDEFWSSGKEISNPTDEQNISTRVYIRERISAASLDDAIKIALAQYFQSNEQQTVVSTPKPRPFLSKLVQKVKGLKTSLIP